MSNVFIAFQTNDDTRPIIEAIEAGPDGMAGVARRVPGAKQA